MMMSTVIFDLQTLMFSSPTLQGDAIASQS